MIIGICGGTGSGKTTIARKVVENIGRENVILIEQDSYYYHLGDIPFEERRLVNFDHPDSLDIDLLVSHVRSLRSGLSIELPVYDFATYERQPGSIHTDPKPVVIIEGILIFADPRILNLLDLRVFVDTPDDIRFIRRLQRDVIERGYTVETVMDRYTKTVRPMHYEFVEPSKQMADLIIPESTRPDVAVDVLCGKIREELRAC